MLDTVVLDLASCSSLQFPAHQEHLVVDGIVVDVGVVDLIVVDCVLDSVVVDWVD